MFKPNSRVTLFFSGVLLSVSACGSETISGSGAGGATGSGSTASGAGTDVCAVLGAGCLSVDDSNIYTVKTCVEIVNDAGEAPPTLESDCLASAASNPNVTSTVVPEGCPRDDDMTCGRVTVFSGGKSISFNYLSGDSTLDTNLCNTCDAFPDGCCHGPAFP